MKKIKLKHPLKIRDISEISLKKQICNEEDDLFARTNEGDGYMQCQVHIRNSNFCYRPNHKFSHFSEGNADFIEARGEIKRLGNRSTGEVGKGGVGESNKNTK